MLDRRSSTPGMEMLYCILSVPSTQPAVLHGRRLSQPSARSAWRARVAWARIPGEYAWQQCHSLSLQHYEPLCSHTMRAPLHYRFAPSCPKEIHLARCLFECMQIRNDICMLLCETSHLPSSLEVVASVACTSEAHLESSVLLVFHLTR